MKIAFLINDIATEKPAYTTVRLAMEAVKRDHQVWLISASDLTYEADETISAMAYPAVSKRFRSPNTFLAALQNEKTIPERIILDELDVLMLRSDPAEESGYRAWAKTAGIIFGRVAQRSGLIVLNDPDGLAEAMDKMYIHQLPESVRPKAIITQSRDEVKDFVKDMGGTAVLKGMQGTGNQSVFLVTPDNRANLNQMIEAITRDDYVVAEEYVSESEKGSTRIFLMNGEPLRYRGKYAAFQWIRKPDELRTNIHVAGSTAKAEITDAHLQIAEAVRPRLVQDGMFLASLHIAGNKLLDINVFSPGGLGIAQSFEKANFSDAVIAALEHKVSYMYYYRRNFDNVDLASL
ncbi:MAG: glutathione synthase [Gammaproteobacteria bacterium]|nr:glutathione synthase [Gammaproteobacteria bacterium]